MSLLDERNFYKPFDYGWAYEAYKKQNQMHWMPEEVPLQDDIRDYKEKLTPANRALVDNIFRFFTQADVDVCCGYAKHYLPTFKAPEVRMMLVSFAAMEAVHQDAYSLLLETLGIGLIVPVVSLMMQGNLVSNYPMISSIVIFFGGSSQIDVISVIMLGFLTVYAIKNLFLVFLAWVQNSFVYNVQANLSQRLFEIYLKGAAAFIKPSVAW